ncbi:MAG: helix-turn-helix domain-containing protein [Myxococcota bacterium]
MTYLPEGAAPTPSATLLRAAPPPSLSAQVAAFFSVEVPPGAAQAEVRALPDGCSDLIFDLGEAPRGWLGGPKARARCFTHRRGARLLGVQLLPGAGHLLLGEPMVEWVDRSAPLERLASATEAHALLESLARTETLTEAAPLLSAFLEPRFQRKNVDPRVTRAFERIVAAGGQVAIPELAEEAHASARHLGRLFDQWIGLSPKGLARVVRFQAVLDRLGRGERPDWSALADELGYADQAHLVRDFVAFAGLAPTAAAPP